MEILSHINKRVKSQRHIPLPLQPLVTLALQPSPVPMVRNFALVYAELAFERAPPQQQLEVVSHGCVMLNVMSLSCIIGSGVWCVLLARIAHLVVIV